MDKGDKKVRKKRDQRDSSVSSSAEQPLGMPRPVQREHSRPGEEGLGEIEERVNQADEDGTFRDYFQQATHDRDDDDSQLFSDTAGKITILQKNTDFNVDADYSLNAFKEQPQPKKYLKSSASPVKTSKQFKEDQQQQ